MRIVVQEWEKVLLYRDGRFKETLDAGRHRRFRWRQKKVRVVVRPRLVSVPAQEILTADGLSVKLSLTATCRTHDPRTWHEAVEEPETFLYSAIQIGLRDAVTARTLESLINDRHEIGVEVLTAAVAAAAQIGVTLDDVAVRDVMVPAEVRRAAAELATTRSQGLAALERARSEVAATRALLNAAKAFADNPALLQLRTLQAVEAGGGTVVLNAPTVTQVAK